MAEQTVSARFELLRVHGFARRTLAEKRLVIALALLGAAAAVLFLTDLFTLARHVPRNPNEGWNAYHALHAMAGAPLYPRPPSLVFNNYPPLSFFLVGALGGDRILAGRLVALASAAGIAGLLFATARRMGCRRLHAACAPLLFLTSPWVMGRLAAIDDPQLLGDLFDAAALSVLAARPGDPRRAAGAGLLSVLALFVKPLYLALPLAAFGWLCRFERRSAAVFALTGLGSGAAGLVAARLALHVDLLPELVAPRLFIVSKMFGQPGQWLLGMGAPLAVTLRPAAWRERHGLFAALYALFAFGLFLFFSGGDGVSASPAVEPSMAVSLGAALFLSRQPGRTEPVVFAAPVAAVLLLSSFYGRPVALAGDLAAARGDIAFLSRGRDAAFCDTAALCYWAGAPDAVDTFGLVEAWRTHRRDPAALVRMLDRHRFRLVQLAPRSAFLTFPAVARALARDYRPDHADGFGRFLVARQ